MQSVSCLSENHEEDPGMLRTLSFCHYVVLGYNLSWCWAIRRACHVIYFYHNLLSSQSCRSLLGYQGHPRWDPSNSLLGAARPCGRHSAYVYDAIEGKIIPWVHLLIISQSVLDPPRLHDYTSSESGDFGFHNTSASSYHSSPLLSFSFISCFYYLSSLLHFFFSHIFFLVSFFYYPFFFLYFFLYLLLFFTPIIEKLEK
jgi:hypothetical protein